MPRSRSSSILSSTCGRCLRASTAPVTSRMRSASVDLPWSIWAMIEKLRMFSAGALLPRSRLGAAEPARQKTAERAGLAHAQQQDPAHVRRDARQDPQPEADDLGDEAAAERV